MIPSICSCIDFDWSFMPKIYTFQAISFHCALSSIAVEIYEALQNKIYLKFKRKVDHGKILTRCPIILVLLSVGFRLKITTSLSMMWRSTSKKKGKIVSVAVTSITLTQPEFTCSKSTMKTPEQCVKSVQSQIKIPERRH